MGLFDIFSSSSKAVDSAANLIDTAVGVIPRLFNTDNDKAKASQQALDTWLEFQKTMANESTASAISRRILAWSITAAFLGMTFLGLFSWPFNPNWSTFIFKEGVTRLEFGFGAVITTYFIKDAVVKGLQANKN